MKRPFNLLILLILTLMSMNSQAQMPDTLQLTNGQVLVGSLVGWQNDRISFYVFDAGVVSVKATKLSILKGNLQQYRTETSIRKIFYGPLVCNKPGEFTFQENDQPVTVPFHNIEIITPYKKGGASTGFLSAGYNYAKSNGVGLVTFDAGLSYTSKQFMLTGSGTTSFVQNNKTLQRNREVVTFTGYRVLNPRWQPAAQLLYQRNLELGLSSRFLAGAGVFYTALMKPNCQLYVATGGMGTLEKTTDKQSYTRFEIPFILNLEIYNLGNPDLSLTHKQSLYIGTDNNKRIRHDGELRLNFKLTKSISLTTYLYDNYDSDPVAATGGNLDYGWTTGLKYGF
jgi:hypothetical protein